ncbi:hypothetical protein GMI69_02255 [Eggerthellaceae bacterium zg-887]|uniref:hypothetical protein n=1 Tax=Xiamenia xianingshaonis TaxID=2682776 RepID=UPI00140CB061|nr:hypothetical protein [Xiamenia xianingshaonis]NHM15496.1 hypothetical protein [Xiamenia xianingshaonis]
MRTNSVARQAALALVVFAVLLVSGLATRPVALAFPQVIALHAVLVAFPSSLCITIAVEKGLHLPWCLAALAAFAGFLAIMSPVMGAASLAPALVAGACGMIWRGKKNRGMAVGIGYGASYYPATVAILFASAGAVFAPSVAGVLTMLCAALLGAALSVFGACLGSLAAARSASKSPLETKGR